jgi:SAM-dependent methyltransferase
MNQEPGPEAVLQIAAGTRRAQVLFSSVELGIFDAAAGQPLTAEQVAARLGLQPRAAGDLLAALWAMGLMDRHGDRYATTAVSDAYLVTGRPGYLGGFLSFLDGVLHPAWRELTTSIRTGAPVRSGDPYEHMYADEAERDGFLEAMDVLNAPIGSRLAQFAWQRARSFADIGGARGNLAVQIRKAHPEMEAAVFDLPRLQPAFEAHMAALGLTGQVRFIAGDFFSDPLPTADVLIFGHVLHNWPPERHSALLAKAHQALPPGGRVVVYDPMMDDRRPHLGAALASLNMLVWSDGGAEYTVSEIRGRMLDAGFASVTAGRLTPATTLVVGRKVS